MAEEKLGGLQKLACFQCILQRIIRHIENTKFPCPTESLRKTKDPASIVAYDCLVYFVEDWM
jgi:hypothetical protein